MTFYLSHLARKSPCSSSKWYYKWLSREGFEPFCTQSKCLSEDRGLNKTCKPFKIYMPCNDLHKKQMFVQIQKIKLDYDSPLHGTVLARTMRYLAGGKNLYEIVSHGGHEFFVSFLTKNFLRHFHPSIEQVLPSIHSLSLSFICFICFSMGLSANFEACLVQGLTYIIEMADFTTSNTHGQENLLPHSSLINLIIQTK